MEQSVPDFGPVAVAEFPAVPEISEVPAAGVVDRRTMLSALLIAVCIMAAIFLKCNLGLPDPINDDEFCYLDLVHAYQRGELSTPIQSLHVHLFSWLTRVSDNEVTQVVRGRQVMSFLFLGMCVFQFLIGRHLMGVPGAAFSVLCYLCLSFTVVNGATFRSDTPAAFLSLAAVYLLIVRPLGWPAGLLAGAAMALACLFTIKAGLYLGLLALLLAIRLRTARDRRASLRSLACFAGAFLLAGATGYLWHKASLPQVSATAGGGHVRGAFAAFFSPGDLFYGRYFFLSTLKNDPIIWLLVALGLGVSLADLRGRERPLMGRTAYMPILFLPLLSILFYRNTFPYYYAFMMPPVTLLCGYVFWRLVSALARTEGRLATVVTVGLTLAVFVPSFVLRYPTLLKARLKTTAQRTLVDAVHAIFPEPVPYLDCPHMVGSFPSVASFMGSVAIEHYLQAGRPVLKGILAEKRPVFLLVNRPYLDPEPARRPMGPGRLTLLDEDWEALKSYFIPHWGPIWVVGRRLDLAADRGPQVFDAPVAGTYTLEADGDVQIDGAVYRPGDTVELAREGHVIEPAGPVRRATLRWGDHLWRPIVSPPPRYLCE
ncbi:MAG: hypothetical protein M1376_20610 [Planctomycetes bacterium]|nr:hypothetical protein [Planctomycetota bacterium]